MAKLWSGKNDLVKNEKSSGVKNNLVKNLSSNLKQLGSKHLYLA